MPKFSRRDILLDKNQIEKIESAKLALFGLGGVGGYALEIFARTGFKDFILCDGDSFSESNLNRQLLSLESNIGMKKTEVAKERILTINKDVDIKTYDFFINEETINNINLDGYYIVDMIDDVNAKVLLAKHANEHNLKIISMMGAGKRIDATFIKSDIYKTENDPLARIMRKKLKENGIKKLNVIYTKDLPLEKETTEIGSLANVVMKAGATVASEVLKEIIYE